MYSNSDMVYIDFYTGSEEVDPYLASLNANNNSSSVSFISSLIHKVLLGSVVFFIKTQICGENLDTWFNFESCQLLL